MKEKKTIFQNDVHPCIFGKYAKNRQSHQGSTIPIFGKSEIRVNNIEIPVKAKKSQGKI